MFVAFGAALADCLRPGSISRPRRIVMMTLQALTGVGMMYVGVNGTAGAVLVIVAAEAAITFAARGAWLWVVAQTLGIAFVLRQFDNWSDTIALTGAYADRAHALVRCVQEIVTNATRHGQAANLWIRIAAQPGGIALDARDDGRGAREVTWGHGLTGMRERFAELSGSIDVTAGSGRGFEIRGFMPCRGTVS